VCKAHGKCTARHGLCIATENLDCQKTNGCHYIGHCSAVAGECVAATDADCQQSAGCKKEGLCTAVDNSCEKGTGTVSEDESTNPAGFLFVDGGKVDVPFPVVHTLFNFEEAIQTAKDHRDVCGGKTKNKRRRSDCSHERWFGVLNSEKPITPLYMAPRDNGSVRQILLHSTRTIKLPAAIRMHVSIGGSTHIMIDSDGTVYQLADLAMATYSVRKISNTSISIDVVGRPVALENEGRYATPEPHLEKLNLRRPIVTFNLRGKTIRSRGSTSAQQTSVTAVCKALVRAFPTVQRRVPRDGEGKVPFDTLKEPGGFSGILGGFHASPSRWGPGPGIDWEALEKAIQ